MKGRRLNLLLAAIAIVCPLVLYVVGYFMLAQRGMGMGNLATVYYSPAYSEDFDTSMRLATFFRPLHKLDQAYLRPGMWKQETLVDHQANLRIITWEKAAAADLEER